MRALPCQIEAGAAAAARKLERGPNPSQAVWARQNGKPIFKVPLSVTGAKPWFRIVRQPKNS